MTKKLLFTKVSEVTFCHSVRVIVWKKNPPLNNTIVVLFELKYHDSNAGKRAATANALSMPLKPIHIKFDLTKKMSWADYEMSIKIFSTVSMVQKNVLNLSTQSKNKRLKVDTTGEKADRII